MAKTTFIDFTTKILASWLNEVNKATYEAIGDGVNPPQTPANVRTNLGIGDRDTSNGYPGLTSLKINFKNAANTFTSFFTNANTAARTYTFPDRDITVAAQEANLWASTQRPHYLNTATAAGGSSFAYDPPTHGQVALITVSTAGVVTFGAPTNIIEGTPYTFLLKAGDTGAKTYAWNAAYKFGSATAPLTSSTIVAGAYDLINFIGGATNTLIYNGHKGDIR
jgi:hypothetical protein